MGLTIDTGVFVFIERRKLVVDWQQLFGPIPFTISAVTASELLVGAFRANNQARRDHRIQVLDAIVASMTVLDYTLATARIHAPIHADLQSRGLLIGAHDLIIAATALEHGHAVLTTNRREFERVAGLTVLDFPAAP